MKYILDKDELAEIVCRHLQREHELSDGQEVVITFATETEVGQDRKIFCIIEVRCPHSHQGAVA